MRAHPSSMLHNLTALAVLAVVLTAGVATAHGPTVRVSYKGIQPERLVVEVGQTVHFHNANSSGAPCTIVAEGGAFVSPTLGRAEGYHYTFEELGTVQYKIQEFPGVTGRVTVVEPGKE